MSKNSGYEQYFNVGSMKTRLSTEQLKALRDPIAMGLDFLDKNKVQVPQEDYKNLFQAYQQILNTYNNMIDLNMIQSKYIDSRTIVSVQPIIDGCSDYTTADWERQFTANNLNVAPYAIPPVNTFRETKDFNKYASSVAKNLMQTDADKKMMPNY